MSIPGFIAEETQAARDLALHETQCRLDSHASCRIQNLVGNAIGIENRSVLADPVELLLRAEELEQPLLPVVIGDASLLPQLAQAVPAVLGQADHPALVAPVSLLGAVGQHVGEPAPQAQLGTGPEHQRPVLHHQPLHALIGMPGAAHGAE